MKCDACRCYADDTFGNPNEDQTCGVKRNGYVLPCKPTCCDGGCPVQGAAEPYGFGKMIDIRVYIRAILTLFALSIILIYLKIWGL
jgi:hypothetical protein